MYCSVIQLSLTLQPHGLQHTRLPCSLLSQNHVHRVGDAIQQSHSLPPTSPPALNVSQHQGLLMTLCIRWPKYWSISFSISPSNEQSGLISFRIDWFDLLIVQGTLKSLLQPHSSKALILQHYASFMVQISHLYMTTGKIILTIWIFVHKVVLFFLVNLE